jgi:hypothetical protein
MFSGMIRDPKSADERDSPLGTASLNIFDFQGEFLTNSINNPCFRRDPNFIIRLLVYRVN